MEEFEASLKSLQQRIEARQAAFRVEIDQESTALAALQRLRVRTVECRAAFDEEDVRQIDACIAARQRRKAELEREHGQQQLLRQEKEALFEKLLRTISERSSVLDTEDASSEVLRKHEDLLRFFAQKQNTMQALLKREVDGLLMQP